MEIVGTGKGKKRFKLILNKEVPQVAVLRGRMLIIMRLARAIMPGMAELKQDKWSSEKDVDNE